MDGIYINDATSSAPSSAAGRLLGLESIEELHLVSSPFDAEYGRAAGGYHYGAIQIRIQPMARKRL